jgi:hypothetical protein
VKSGYWQMVLHTDDREKTGFSMGQGLWQFTVTPFGLCSAPATFERLMEIFLRGFMRHATRSWLATCSRNTLTTYRKCSKDFNRRT